VQQKTPPDQADLPEAVKSDIKSEPADIKPDEIEIGARLIAKPSQLAGETVTLPKKSAYRRTMIELGLSGACCKRLVDYWLPPWRRQFC
jgi:hypothetical protein